MLVFTGYFLLTLVYSDKIIGHLNALPLDNKEHNALNGTTTAVPPYNVSTTTKTAHTPTTSTSTSATMPTTNANGPKSATFNPKLITSSGTTVPTIFTAGGYSEAKIKHNFVTTTAAPPFIGPIPTYRQFDGLSFAGGALAMIGVIVLGTFIWKMYIARIERSYWML